MSDHITNPFTEYQQYTLEPIPDFPEGFTYMDGYDHAPVGETYVLMSDAIAALAAQDAAHEDSLAEAEQALASMYQRRLSAYDDGVSDERARIRAGVDDLPGEALSGISYLDEAAVFAVINGPDATGTATHVNRADHPPYTTEETR